MGKHKSRVITIQSESSHAKKLKHTHNNSVHITIKLPQSTRSPNHRNPILKSKKQRKTSRHSITKSNNSTKQSIGTTTRISTSFNTENQQLVSSGRKKCSRRCIAVILATGLLISAIIAGIVLGVLLKPRPTSQTTGTTTAFPALAISVPSTYCGCDGFTLSLMNMTFNATNATTYQWQSSPVGQHIWTNINHTSTISTIKIPYQVNSMDYRCIIYTVNLISENFISASITVLTTTNTTYCPTRIIDCFWGDGIDNFTLFGESNTIIDDTDTGCSINSYDNRTSESVSLYLNKNYTAQVSSLFPADQILVIWIDFNNNFNFEMWECISNQTLNSTYLTDVIVSIPSSSVGATIGTHRMRATAIYEEIPDSCSSIGVYGETHDYTVNILAATG